MSDTDVAKDVLVGELETPLASNTNARAEVQKQRTRRYTFKKTAADSMASDTTAEAAGPPWERLFAAGRVTAIYITANAAVTGHADNHATVTVSKRDAAGANKTTLGTYTTDTDVSGQGSLVAGVGKAFALTAANTIVVEGGSLTMEIAKGGTGVVLAISTIEVHVVDEG